MPVTPPPTPPQHCGHADLPASRWSQILEAPFHHSPHENLSCRLADQCMGCLHMAVTVLLMSLSAGAPAGIRGQIRGVIWCQSVFKCHSAGWWPSAVHRTALTVWVDASLWKDHSTQTCVCKETVQKCCSTDYLSYIVCNDLCPLIICTHLWGVYEKTASQPNK